jgi:uncharacterized beta-barrel protein YwiB (DUF1934 family)
MQTTDLTLTVHSVIDNLDDAGLPDGEPEINIFTTGGTLTEYEAGYRLVFTESSEGQESTSTLTLTAHGVTLKKRGAIESDMIFREGAIIPTVYKVGPYAFDMEIRTKKIRSSLSQDGGELQLMYTMNIGGQEKSVRMKISAKRK